MPCADDAGRSPRVALACAATLAATRSDASSLSALANGSARGRAAIASAKERESLPTPPSDAAAEAARSAAGAREEVDARMTSATARGVRLPFSAPERAAAISACDSAADPRTTLAAALAAASSGRRSSQRMSLLRETWSLAAEWCGKARAWSGRSATGNRSHARPSRRAQTTARSCRQRLACSTSWRVPWPGAFRLCWPHARLPARDGAHLRPSLRAAPRLAAPREASPGGASQPLPSRLVAGVGRAVQSGAMPPTPWGCQHQMLASHKQRYMQPRARTRGCCPGARGSTRSGGRDMPSSSRRPDVPWESIEVLQRGAPLLKFGRHGEPHFR